MLWLDDYERRARLLPGLLVLLPIVAAAIVLGLHDVPLVSVLVGVLVSFGGPVVLADWVRERGLKLQERLFRDWNGAPTRRRIQWHAPDAGSPLWRRRRAAVAGTTATELPDRESEDASPESADANYEAAVGVARELLRDKQQFPLVYEENKGYGFKRNLLAMRPFGLASAGISILGAAVATGIDLLTGMIGFMTVQMLFALLVPLLLMAFWAQYPGERRVKDAAERYADRFFTALETVEAR